MRQVLFDIPLDFLHEGWHLPVYGYGLMLFFAFIGCSWLAKRMCRREGIDSNFIPDLAITLFATGLIGGRIVYVIQYWQTTPTNPVGFDQRPLLDTIKLWDGGLVLYGALFGGAAGYFGFWWTRLKPKGVSNWKMFDVVAPCLALGVAFGRIGCLCTGCCYGDVAGESCPAPLHFPAGAGAWGKMVALGYQTPFGFVLNDKTLIVKGVEPGSAADGVLQPGDEIVQVGEEAALSAYDVRPSKGFLRLTVVRDGETIPLPAFAPTSIGVNPTQIFETISMVLLLFLLLSYYPYKHRDGALMVVFMFCYGVHRFLNEMLRTDTDPVAFGLTLSQNISILVLAAGVILAVVVWRRPKQSETPAPPFETVPTPAIETAVPE